MRILYLDKSNRLKVIDSIETTMFISCTVEECESIKNAPQEADSFFVPSMNQTPADQEKFITKVQKKIDELNKQFENKE